MNHHSTLLQLLAGSTTWTRLSTIPEAQWPEYYGKLARFEDTDGWSCGKDWEEATVRLTSSGGLLNFDIVSGRPKQWHSNNVMIMREDAGHVLVEA